MTSFKGFPEINLVEGQAEGLHRIETNTGRVIIAGHFGSTEEAQRLVDCWNACRKLYAPAAHIAETDAYVLRLEDRRKEAVAIIALMRAEADQIAGSASAAKLSLKEASDLFSETAA